MVKFVKKTEAFSKNIIRIPETGKDLLPEGQNVIWSPYWGDRVRSGIVTIVTKEKRKEREISPKEHDKSSSRKSKSKIKE